MINLFRFSVLFLFWVVRGGRIKVHQPYWHGLFQGNRIKDLAISRNAILKIIAGFSSSTFFMENWGDGFKYLQGNCHKKLLQTGRTGNLTSKHLYTIFSIYDLVWCFKGFTNATKMMMTVTLGLLFLKIILRKVPQYQLLSRL